MVLKILPAEEADMYRSAVIEHDAYAHLNTNDILFPGPLPPNVLELRAEEMKSQAREPNAFCFKVIDTELEEGEQMISFAKWQGPLWKFPGVVYDDNSPPQPRAQREWPPGTNGDACELLFGGLAMLKERNIGGRNHVYLQLLHTDPRHRGRGAASMLIPWGIEEAARRCLPAYLESSEAAHGLYLKHHFRDLEELTTDFSNWGLQRPHRAWAMMYT
ncbi:hypothetical protein VPNG_07198 [Cytospora leucostoma]|uniref:N-acetyltransferase domain-containing protein n=1 Tax=Cytospora leucostoma TaxID=1230097 RepID=A0A423WJN0_9PEZI|nr:hypothetical protein VPNG_07198 [Cytospora leucostoma]